MPSYVCPECGEPAIERLVIVEGTQMHYTSDIKLKGARNPAATMRSRAEAFRQRAS